MRNITTTIVALVPMLLLAGCGSDSNRPYRILEHLGHTAEPVDPANPSRAPPQGDLLI